MPTDDDVIARWEQRQRDWARHKAQVDGVSVCDEVLADLRAMAADPEQPPLTLTEAASLSGYTREHLGRLVRQGKIENAGGPNAPRIRLKDLPRKAGYLPPKRAPAIGGPVQASDLPTERTGTHIPNTDVHELASRLRRGKEGHDGL
jgi:hypothetical protein